MFPSASAVMDVLTGVVFIFLLVSLVCSQISDKIADWLRFRAKGLEDGLRRFVVGDVNLQQMLYANPLIHSLVPEDSLVTQGLEKIPVLKRLIRTQQNPTKIPARTFTLALFDTLIPNASGQTNIAQLRAAVATLPPGSPMRGPLLSIVSTAENDIGKVRQNIEDWFNTTMDKTTKLYQGHMWRISFALAVAVAVVLNVDTVSVSISLWNDATLRSALVAEANKYAQGTPDKDKALQALDRLNLPVGWQILPSPQTADPFSSLVPASIKPIDWLAKPNRPETELDLRSVVSKLAGWLVTALAGAQGAPFWYDLLKKIAQRA